MDFSNDVLTDDLNFETQGYSKKYQQGHNFIYDSKSLQIFAVDID